MTTASSPGISLKQEGLSYMVGAELPGVIVNMMRGGPGLGGIQPGQADYFQATRSVGHGDGHMPVLAPQSIQEAVELVQDAFDLADQYRTPVMVLADGMIGQMMEAITWTEREKRPMPEKDWAAKGRKGPGKTNFVTSLRLDAHDNEEHNQALKEKYDRIAREETRYQAVDCEGAQVLLCAFGTTARIAHSAAQALTKLGIPTGLFRPITLWPFPGEALKQAALQDSVRMVLTVEMNMGQMVEDVRLSLLGAKPTPFYGRTGGVVPTVEEIVERVQALMKEENA